MRWWIRFPSGGQSVVVDQGDVGEAKGDPGPIGAMMMVEKNDIKAMVSYW
jgi:hypothetical protein